jgi:hypothetical protein
MSFVLKIDKQQPGAAPEHFRFEGHGRRIVRLGRLRTCHVPLDEPRIAKLQAVIVMEDCQGRLECIGTPSAMRINGQPLTDGRTIPLGTQSVVEVGDTRLDVSIRPGGGESTVARLRALVARSGLGPAAELVKAPDTVDRTHRPAGAASSPGEHRSRERATERPRRSSAQRRLSLREVFDDLQLPPSHVAIESRSEPGEETRRMVVKLQREHTRRRAWLALGMAAGVALAAVLAARAPIPAPESLRAAYRAGPPASSTRPSAP